MLKDIAVQTLRATGEGGQVVGESDAKREVPKDKANTPDDVAAMFYHELGIDSRKEYNARTDRPIMIVCNVRH